MKEIIVPVVAPLNQDLSLDREAVRRIFTFLHENNASPFILGTTGEAASLSKTFREEYLEVAAASRLENQRWYVGVSSNILEESIVFSQQAHALGVTAIAATLPNYYQLSVYQMERYFVQLADSCQAGLIVYNIPVTTHMSLPLDLLERLSQHPNIVGLKDSERNMERLEESLKRWANREDFNHYIGWAGAAGYALLNGSSGVVPSTGNFAPSVYVQMCAAAEKHDVDMVQMMQKHSDELGNLYQANKSLGESLWALKVLMRELGLCEEYMMPPLNRMDEKERQQIIQRFHELINNQHIKLNRSHV